MNVKRYIAKDVNEAMIKIKNELGSDAIILNTRKINKPGFFGFFKKSLVEVVAAIDEVEPVKPNQDLANEEIKKLRDEVKKVVEIRENSSTETLTETPVDDKDVQINELKQMIKELAEKVENVESSNDKKTEITQDVDRIESDDKEEAVSKEDISLDDIQKIRKKLDKILKDKEISEKAIQKITENLNKRLNIEEASNKQIIDMLKLIVKQILDEPYTIEEALDSKKTVLFIGPTGVGKTTTLAKIAAKLSLESKKDVALITADTYRIAAVEQLKTYSEILVLPLKVIYEAEDIEQALDEFHDKDIILIDTAGRSHKSEDLYEDLKSILKYIPNPEIFLVISLTTGYKDIKSIVKSYDFLDEYKLILTKMDETSSVENVLNIKVETDMQLSYFTTGQNVPDDIEVADADKIVEYIVGE